MSTKYTFYVISAKIDSISHYATVFFEVCVKMWNLARFRPIRRFPDSIFGMEPRQIGRMMEI